MEPPKPGVNVRLRLTAGTREDLELAIARVKAAGLNVAWLYPSLNAPVVDGTLELYDTPETVEAKLRAAGAIMQRASRSMRCTCEDAIRGLGHDPFCGLPSEP
jgi:hypothetical protein